MAVKVAFDTTFLTLLFNEKAPASVPRARERLDGLIEKLAGQKTKIIVPTVALCEVLVAAGRNGAAYLDVLGPKSVFEIRAFDERCAVELSIMLRTLRPFTSKQFKKTPASSKIKFDRQIVATAKVHGAARLYSDDRDMRNFAREAGLEAIGFADLAIPPIQEQLFTPE